MDPDRQQLLPHNRQIHALADLNYPRHRLIKILRYLLTELGEQPPDPEADSLAAERQSRRIKSMPMETIKRAPVVSITSKANARGSSFLSDPGLG
jgi:hypothetical protein